MMLAKRFRALPRRIYHRRFIHTRQLINTKCVYGIDEYGRKDGIFEERYANGNLKTACYFDKGRLDGSLLERYENGNLRVHGNYLRGTLHGENTEFDSRGVILRQCNYDMNLLQGPCITNENGCRQETNYKNNNKHGEYKEWNTEGLLTRKCNYYHGKLCGQYESWWNNGNRHTVSYYKDDELEGLSTNYYANGNPQDRATYSKGKLHGKYTEWRHDDPDAIYEYIYENDKPVKAITLRRKFHYNDTRNHVLPDGDIEVWKACKAGDKIVYVKLFVPAAAKRVATIFSSGQSRVEYATVLEIFDKDGNKYDKAESINFKNFKYQVGKVATPDKFDDDMSELSNGIYVYKYQDCCDDYMPKQTY